MSFSMCFLSVNDHKYWLNLHSVLKKDSSLCGVLFYVEVFSTILIHNFSLFLYLPAHRNRIVEFNMIGKFGKHKNIYTSSKLSNMKQDKISLKESNIKRPAKKKV